MKTLIHALFLVIFFYSAACSAENLNFTLHKLGKAQDGPTLLIIGGIQGDEPGGFNAASLIVTDYTITSGNVWVVPNLNFISIINRTRGVYGDMNRKFSTIKNTDPELETIKKIKEIILDKNVTMVLNLHDGSGFYRPGYVDRWHCPDRWGQCIIIDREKISTEKFGHLQKTAEQVVASVNRHLYAEGHRYHIKNTKTHLGNPEMEKTLSYFAVKNGVPAFGLEVSKSFPTHKRAYYHLRAIEAFMDTLNIKYKRNFSLTADKVRSAIRNNVRLVLYENKIFLDMKNARNRLNYLPLKKDSDISFTPSNPLLTIVPAGEKYRVYHGNRRIAHIHPQYFDYDTGSTNIHMEIDGTQRSINFGKMVSVADSFMVMPKDGYRVNIIGYRKEGASSECGIKIRKKDIQERFSLDMKGDVYRVEVYKDELFSGMVLVNFEKGPAMISYTDPDPLPPSFDSFGR